MCVCCAQMLVCIFVTDRSTETKNEQVTCCVTHFLVLYNLYFRKRYHSNHFAQVFFFFSFSALAKKRASNMNDRLSGWQTTSLYKKNLKHSCVPALKKPNITVRTKNADFSQQHKTVCTFLAVCLFQIDELE